MAAGILVAGLLVRAAGIWDRPFWLAEINELAYGYRDGFWSNLPYAAGDLPGYLWHSLGHLFTGEPHPLFARLPSLLLGAALGPLLFLRLARQVCEPRVAALAGLLVALSLPLADPAQDCRWYMGMIVFEVLAWTEALARSARLRRVGLLHLAAVVSHPAALAWALPHLILLTILRLRGDGAAGWRPLLWLYLPVFTGAAVQIFMVTPIWGGYRSLGDTFVFEARPPGPDLVQGLFLHLTGATGASAAIWSVLAFLGLAELWERRRESLLVLLIWTALVPIAIVIVVWLLGVRYSGTYLLPAAPALIILLAEGAGGLARRSPAGVPLQTALLVSLALAPTLGGTFDIGRWIDRPVRMELGADLRSACAFVASHSSPGDVLIVPGDKHFTAASWSCSSLASGVSIVSNLPEDRLARRYLSLHLTPPDEGSVLSLELISPLTTEALPEESSAPLVFLVLPAYEENEAHFSDTAGWFGRLDTLGPSRPAGAPGSGWNHWGFTLCDVYWRRLETGNTDSTLRELSDALAVRREVR